MICCRILNETLARERLNLDQYLQLMGKTRAEYREEMKPEAERRIRQRRALERGRRARGTLGLAMRTSSRCWIREATGNWPAHVRAPVAANAAAEPRSSLLRDKSLDWLTEHQIASESTEADEGTQAALAAHGAASAGEPAGTEPDV